MRRILILPALAIALGACQSTAPGGTAGTPSASAVTLSGTAAYRERILLPPDARLTVRISDVSRMDAPATVIAESNVATEGRQVPLAFSLTYDPARIDPRGRYSVSARITDANGQLAWTTDTQVPLPPPGQPVTLMLVRVAR